MNAIEIAELLEHSALGNLGDFAYVADAAKELRRLAAVEAELATATAAGRAEAVVIIMSLSPDEDPLGDCIDCSGPNIGGEYDCSWNENKLLAKFEADAKHFQLLSRSDAQAEVLFYDNLQYKQHIAELEAELVALREQEPVVWRVYCPTWGSDSYGLWNSYKKDDRALAHYLGRPECDIEYAYLAKEDPAPPAQLSGNSEQLSDWPEDHGEHPQRGLGVQS